MEGFLSNEFGGLIHGGAYFRNFTVCHLTNLYSPHWTDTNMIKSRILKNIYFAIVF